MRTRLSWGGLLPLYRLYSSGATDHLYTISAAERDNASNHLGYIQEGIALPLLERQTLCVTMFAIFFSITLELDTTTCTVVYNYVLVM
jgi:hypothetical protein